MEVGEVGGKKGEELEGEVARRARLIRRAQSAANRNGNGRADEVR